LEFSHDKDIKPPPHPSNMSMQHVERCFDMLLVLRHVACCRSTKPAQRQASSTFSCKRPQRGAVCSHIPFDAINSDEHITVISKHELLYTENEME